MLVPKKNRLAVYSYLFKEGVLCCKKELTLDKHDHIEVPNLQVVKLMQSMTSRGLVREKYSWQWLYYFLTDEGIEYLREYLHLSAETVPATMKKQTKPAGQPSFRSTQGGERGPRRNDRDGYRGKKDGAPDNFNPRYARGGERSMRGRQGPRA